MYSPEKKYEFIVYDNSTTTYNCEGQLPTLHVFKTISHTVMWEEGYSFTFNQTHKASHFVII